MVAVTVGIFSGYRCLRLGEGFSPLPLGWGGVGLGGVKAESGTLGSLASFSNLILPPGFPGDQ